MAKNDVAFAHGPVSGGHLTSPLASIYIYIYIYKFVCTFKFGQFTDNSWMCILHQ